MIMSIKLWKIFFNTGIYMCIPIHFADAQANRFV